MKYKCEKCKDTGWYMYDHNHGARCDGCCKCDQGYWHLLDHYGENNGKFCCLNGCGKTKDPDWNRELTPDKGAI